MPTGVKDLRIYQAAREAAYGTDLAATNRLVGELEITPVETVVMPQPQIGMMLDNPTTDQIVQRSAEVKLSGELTYEQILYLLEGTIDGAVTPTGAGPYVYTYTPLFSADPLSKSFTFERRLTDGTTNWDEVVNYALCKDWKISAAIGEMVKFESNWIGRPVDTAQALTAAIAVPAVNFISAADVIVYFDTTFAGIGGTALAGDVISWELAYQGVYQPKFFQDGRADRSFSTHSVKRQGYTLNLQVEWNAQIAGLRAAAGARSLRYVRVKATSDANHIMQFDGVYRFKAGQFDQAGDRDGNDTATLELVSALDTAQSLGLKAIITNQMATWL